ncbi:hypothetical protein [Aquisphaera insulae]|uniref:hypothetical protein n=1 Tax=Aquisphaera insulae TaxID=2712864 RepID=UPI0013ED8517|nr:hypothetical protein [Aquisphaera insulae]
METEPAGWGSTDDRGPKPDRERLAFFLVSLSAGLAGAYLLLVFLSFNSRNQAFRGLVNDPGWDHYLGGPLMAANVLASILILGCRPGKEWTTRAWTLLIVALVNGAFWCVDHAHFFGWDQADHGRLQDPVWILWIRCLALVRVVTLAELAALVAAEPGSTSFSPLRGQTIRIAVTAFLMWLFFEATHVDAQQAPPRWLPIMDLASYGLYVGCILTRALSSISLAILAAAAFLASSRRIDAARATEYSWGAGVDDPGGAIVAR